MVNLLRTSSLDARSTTLDFCTNAQEPQTQPSEDQRACPMWKEQSERRDVGRWEIESELSHTNSEVRVQRKKPAALNYSSQRNMAVGDGVARVSGPGDFRSRVVMLIQRPPLAAGSSPCQPGRPVPQIIGDLNAGGDLKGRANALRGTSSANSSPMRQRGEARAALPPKWRQSRFLKGQADATSPGKDLQGEASPGKDLHAKELLETASPGNGAPSDLALNMAAPLTQHRKVSGGKANVPPWTRADIHSQVQASHTCASLASAREGKEEAAAGRLQYSIATTFLEAIPAPAACPGEDDEDVEIFFFRDSQATRGSPTGGVASVSAAPRKVSDEAEKYAWVGFQTAEDVKIFPAQTGDLTGVSPMASSGHWGASSSASLALNQYPTGRSSISASGYWGSSTTRASLYGPRFQGSCCEVDIRPSSSPASLPVPVVASSKIMANRRLLDDASRGSAARSTLTEAHHGRQASGNPEAPRGSTEGTTAPKPILVQRPGKLQHARSLGRRVRFNKFVDEIICS